MSDFLHLITAILNDPHVQQIINVLSVIIVASKIAPALDFLGTTGKSVLRILGLTAQLILALLGIIRWWTKTHPNGKKLADETIIDEKIDKIILSHDSKSTAAG